MKSKHVIAVFAILLILAFSFAAFAGPKANDKSKRVIAHTDDEVASAVAKGCAVVRDAKTLKALVCSEQAAAELGLQEDIRVFAVDAGANAQINADDVHVSGNTGAGRKVAVLDTGYNYLHPELVSSYLGGRDFVNDDDDPFDDNGHGSHVSGIITADGVNATAKGVAPDAGIIAHKVLDAGGSGFFSDVIAAIYRSVDGPDGVPGTADDPNADAISMSLGTSPPFVYKTTCDTVLPDLTAAIKYARDRGIVVVVAAGNSGRSGVSIPGCISYSVTVGAVNSADKIASFSGRGQAVDIVAPGVSIFSAWLGTSYLKASGTSMATPMVSGTVALVKNAHPAYIPNQTENALFKTAKDLGKTGKDTTFGWGRVDALGAVNFVA